MSRGMSNELISLINSSFLELHGGLKDAQLVLLINCTDGSASTVSCS